MEQTPLLVLSNLLLYAIMFLLLRKVSRPPYKLSKGRRSCAIFFIYLFCLFAFFDGDYFHYMQIYDNSYNGESLHHLEDVYYYIYDLSLGSYILFRMLIWGSAFTLFMLSIKRFSLNFDFTLYLFIILVFLKFAYPRISLGYACLFLGLSYWVNPLKKRMFSYILGAFMMGLSLAFHKSMLFGIGIVMISTIANKINKKHLVFFLMMSPFLIFILSRFLGANLADAIENSEDELLAGKSIYLDVSRSNRGIGQLVLNLLERAPYFLTVFLYFKIIWKKSTFNALPYRIRIIANSLFFILFASVLMALNPSGTTYVFYYRFLYFSIIPLTLFLSYCITNKIYLKLSSFIILIGMFSTFYKLVYVYYCTILKN